MAFENMVLGWWNNCYFRERKTNCVKVCIRDDFGITKNPEIVP